MRQAYSKQAPPQPAVSRLSGNGENNGNDNGDSPKNGKGNEIYGTIRHAAPATAVAASAHARDRALHGSDSAGPASPIHAERNIPSTTMQANRGDTFSPGEVGMDDVILDTVIIPAIESVSQAQASHTTTTVRADQSLFTVSYLCVCRTMKPDRL